MTKPKLPSSSPPREERGGRRDPSTWPSPSPFTFTWDAWVTKWTGTQSSTSWAREFPKGATKSGKPWPLSRLFIFSATSRHVVALVSLWGRKRRSVEWGCCSHPQWSQASTARVLSPASLFSHSPKGGLFERSQNVSNFENLGWPGRWIQNDVSQPVFHREALYKEGSVAQRVGNIAHPRPSWSILAE